MREASLSVDAVSVKTLKETVPMILARLKTAAYKSSSAPRKLAEVLRENEASTGMEEVYKPQKANPKTGLTSGQTWEERQTSARSGFRRNTRPLGSI